MLILLACTMEATVKEIVKVEAELVSGGRDACLGINGSYQCQFVDALAFDYGQHDVPQGVSGLSLGPGGSCWLDEDQSLGCRGYNPQKNLNHPEGAFQAVSVGEVHSCALDLEGKITCWGIAQWGLDQAPEGIFISMGVHGYNTCARRPDQTMVCWGWDETGVPINYPDVPVKEISGISHNVCATTEEGEILCWGAEEMGLLHPPSGKGYHGLAVGMATACVLNASDEPVCWGDNEWEVQSIPSGKFQKLAAGLWAMCGLRYDASVECWGCRGDEVTCRWGQGSEPYYTGDESTREFYP
jgi:hypothetical protein